MTPLKAPPTSYVRQTSNIHLESNQRKEKTSLSSAKDDYHQVVLEDATGNHGSIEDVLTAATHTYGSLEVVPENLAEDSEISKDERDKTKRILLDEAKNLLFGYKDILQKIFPQPTSESAEIEKLSKNLATSKAEFDKPEKTKEKEESAQPLHFKFDEEDIIEKEKTEKPAHKSKEKKVKSKEFSEKEEAIKQARDNQIEALNTEYENLKKMSSGSEGEDQSVVLNKLCINSIKSYMLAQAIVFSRAYEKSDSFEFSPGKSDRYVRIVNRLPALYEPGVNKSQRKKFEIAAMLLASDPEKMNTFIKLVYECRAFSNEALRIQGGI